MASIPHGPLPLESMDLSTYPTTSLQQAGFFVVFFFPALALIVVSLRVYNRISARTFGWDDGFIVAAMVNTPRGTPSPCLKTQTEVLNLTNISDHGSGRSGLQLRDDEAELHRHPHLANASPAERPSVEPDLGLRGHHAVQPATRLRQVLCTLLSSSVGRTQAWDTMVDPCAERCQHVSHDLSLYGVGIYVRAHTQVLVPGHSRPLQQRGPTVHRHIFNHRPY